MKLSSFVPSRRSHRSLPALAVAAVLAVAGPSLAAPEVDAQQLFTDAQERFDRSDYAAALPLFQQAFEVSGSPNARLYVARCLRELGRVAEAYDEMHATTREATRRAEKDPKYTATRDSAAAELALLEPKVAKMVIVWTGPSDATVTLDAKPVAPERLGTPMTVLPGEHIVSATPPGGQPIQQTVSVNGGTTKSVTLHASGSSAAPTSSTPTPDGTEPQSPPEEQTTGGEVRIAGAVITGLGVAGMVLFAVAGSTAQGKFSTLEDECGDTRCADPSYEDVIDSGKTWETVANVSLGVGIAAIVGGVAMIIFGGPSEAEEPVEAEPAAARRPDDVRWSLDVGPVAGAGATVGARATF